MMFAVAGTMSPQSLFGQQSHTKLRVASSVASIGAGKQFTVNRKTSAQCGELKREKWCRSEVAMRSVSSFAASSAFLSAKGGWRDSTTNFLYEHGNLTT